MNSDIKHVRKAVDKALSGKLSLVSQQTTKVKPKEPSSRLKALINECASQFSKLHETLEKVKLLGLKEGFTPTEIGDMIRTQMTNAGYHRSTVARYLPPEFKHMEKARSKFGRILLPKAVEEQVKKDIDTTIKEEVEQPTGQYVKTNPQIVQAQHQVIRPIMEITDIERFSWPDRHLYKPDIIAKARDELARIYKEKTKKLPQNKKYQPTPDEVRQREEKVLSLVKEGMRMYDLVKISGIPESPVRRYLLKNGYKVTAGKISR